MKKGRC
jgi:hypothetical protein